MEKRVENKGERRTSTLAKWFRRKKKSKKEMLSDVIALQADMSEKLESFSSDNAEIVEKCKLTTGIVEDLYKILSGFGTDNYKDIIHDLCNQLQNTKSEEKSQSQEIKNLANKIHQGELKLCKMEAENRELNKELLRQEKHSQKLEEREEKLKNSLETMKEEKLNLRLEMQKQENTIQELKSSSNYMGVTADRLSDNIKDQELKIQELKEEKLKIMEYSNSKCKMYEDRLKIAWMKFNDLRQERDALLELKNSARTQMYISRESGVPLEDEAKVLQLELKLYRRDRLIELLAEKIKCHEPEFTLMSDPNLLVYLDQDWYKLAVDTGYEHGADVSSVPSSTQSSTMSYETTDGLEMHI